MSKKYKQNIHHWPIELPTGLAGYYLGEKIDMKMGTYPIVAVLGMLAGWLAGDFIARKIYGEPYIFE